MYVLKKADYEGVYFGKDIHVGDWYGVDTDTNRPLLVSQTNITTRTDRTRVVPIFVFHNNEWRYYEVSFDSEFNIVYNGYLDRVNTGGKNTVCDLPLFVRNLER